MQATNIEIHRDIILACVRGDRNAQFKLYEFYSRAMYNICLRLMRNKEEAEDMLQEAFVLAFRNIASFRFESTFGAWMRRLVVNHCINTLKKKKVNLIYLQEAKIKENSDEDSDLKEEEITMTIEKIYKAMEQLPDGARMILSLYLLDGYKHEEIAAMLNISESTSKTQYMRAKQKVLELIKTMN